MTLGRDRSTVRPMSTTHAPRTFTSTTGTVLPLGVVDTVTVKDCPGYTVDKSTRGYAYAKNGHHDNPTPHVDWIVRFGGVYVGRESTLRGAKELARLHKVIG